MVFIFNLTQFGMSCYASGYMPRGSWTDAQKICEKKGSHLWTINSHEEWYNMYTKQWDKMPNSIKEQSRTPIGQTLHPFFFIGLIDPTQDGNKEVNVVVSRLVMLCVGHV